MARGMAATLDRPRVLWAPARGASSGLDRAYLGAVGLAMALGAYVMVEPAPVDLAVMALLVAGFLLSTLAFRAAHALPAALLAVFIIANVVSLLDAGDQTRAFWYGAVTLYLALSWLFFVGVTSHYGRQALPVLLGGYAVAGVVSVALGTLAYFHVLHFAALLEFGRPKGLFKDPNVYGPYMVPIALYTMARLMDRARRRWFWAGLSAVSMIGIFLSYSRACWLNYLAAVAAYIGATALWQRRAGDLRRWRRLAIGLLLAAITVLASLSLPGVRDMVRERWGSGGLHDYDQARFDTQRKAWDTALAVPLGIGPGQADPTFNYATHNTYLRVLSENGWLGFAAFYAFVALTFTQAVRRVRRAPAGDRLAVVVLACLAGWMVNAAVIDTLHWRHLWLLLALPWMSCGAGFGLRAGFSAGAVRRGAR